ncbi:MAG: class I SAM-dependent methyltransferase, partial [Psychroserpens sp.]|nr:class I SAM-dependent methyltransferase [Psychroserpens sp.]
MNKESIRSFWYSVSPGNRFLLRKLYYLPIDLLDLILGRRHKYVPPRGSIYTGSPASAKSYLDQGQRQLAWLKKEIDLKPEDHVLDIGSGIGRTAIALTNYLNDNGSYKGFDVVKSGVDWCNARIGKDFRNFEFKYVPLYNDLYNTSEQRAEHFTFPYPDNTFDKVFTFSVFTHMQIEEIQNYFSEIQRTLTPSGLAFSTFFIYNDDNELHISENNSFRFPVKKEGFRLMNDTVTSGNIAIHQDKLLEMLKEAGLE